MREGPFLVLTVLIAMATAVVLVVAAAFNLPIPGMRGGAWQSVRIEPAGDSLPLPPASEPAPPVSSPPHATGSAGPRATNDAATNGEELAAAIAMLPLPLPMSPLPSLRPDGPSQHQAVTSAAPLPDAPSGDSKPSAERRAGPPPPRILPPPPKIEPPETVPARNTRRSIRKSRDLARAGRNASLRRMVQGRRAVSRAERETRSVRGKAARVRAARRERAAAARRPSSRAMPGDRVIVVYRAPPPVPVAPGRAGDVIVLIQRGR